MQKPLETVVECIKWVYHHPGYMNPYTRSGMFRSIMNLQAGNEGSCVSQNIKQLKIEIKHFHRNYYRENVEVVKEEDTTTGRRDAVGGFSFSSNIEFPFMMTMTIITSSSSKQSCSELNESRSIEWLPFVLN